MAEGNGSEAQAALERLRARVDDQEKSTAAFRSIVHNLTAASPQLHITATPAEVARMEENTVRHALARRTASRSRTSPSSIQPTPQVNGMNWT
jgi:hypothetical protein